MLRSLFRGSGACQRLLILHLSRSYVRGIREPGISRRLKVFSDDFVENDPETLESMDSDFMNLGEAHKQFEREETQHKQRVSSLIVGRKYFNEKGINFLTWSEKEQIRQLNQQRPEEWTPDKLSLSFPADPLTISKIIRNRWQPKDEKRVYKHDEAVRKSWEKFKAGELEVEPILAEHLKKFSHRKLSDRAAPTTNRKLGTVVPNPRRKEFLSIITSCKKYAEEPTTRKAERAAGHLESGGLRFPKYASRDPEQDYVILEGNIGKPITKSVSLEEYHKLSPDFDLPEEKKNVVQPVEQPREFFKKLKVVEEHETRVSIDFDDKQVYKALEIQQEIKIPKNVWKKDQLYQVGDCFYTDDGEFLYRVPGLK